MEDELNRINSDASQLVSQYENIISSFDLISEETNSLLNQSDTDETLTTKLQNLNVKIQDIKDLANGDLYNKLLELANKIGEIIPKINSGSSMMERINRGSSYQEKQSQKIQSINQMTVLQKDLRNKANNLFEVRNKLSVLSGKVDRKLEPSSPGSYNNSSSSLKTSNNPSPSGFSTTQRRIGFGGKRRSRNRRNKKSKGKRTPTKKRKNSYRK